MNEAQRQVLYQKDLQLLAEKKAITDSNREHIEGTHRFFCEIGEFDTLDIFLRPDTIAIDLGANVGQYSIKLAAVCRKCISFEPVAPIENLASLLPVNCDLHSVAVGDSSGNAIIRIPLVNGKRATGLATLTDLSKSEIYKEFEEQEVPLRTLDEITFTEYPDDEIGFIKIDVEGYEVQAIKGAFRTIRKWKPALLVEIWKNEVASVTKFIEGLGYRGLFFFAGQLYDLSVYDSDLHTADENNWNPEAPEKFDGSIYVNNFFFIPVQDKG